MKHIRSFALVALLATAACSSISGGKPLPMPEGEFTPLNAGQVQGENGLVVSPTPGRSAVGG